MDVFKEWTSRRPWKERKKANKSGTAYNFLSFHYNDLFNKPVDSV